MICFFCQGEDGDSDEESNNPDEEPPVIVLPPTSGGKAAAQKYNKEKDGTAPANYHSMPPIVYDTICDMFSAHLRIDLTPGDGTNCLDAVTNGIAYVGLCQTKFQKETIEKNLVTAVLKSMEDPNSKNYSMSYAKWKQGQVAAEVGKPKPDEGSQETQEPLAKKAKLAAANATTNPPDISPCLAKLLKASQGIA